jgi:hypothetical protein
VRSSDSDIEPWPLTVGNHVDIWYVDWRLRAKEAHGCVRGVEGDQLYISERASTPRDGWTGIHMERISSVRVTIESVAARENRRNGATLAAALGRELKKPEFNSDAARALVTQLARFITAE